ncbi:MAG: DUF1580 domain-containing protein [Planctomycetales bacterium]
MHPSTIHRWRDPGLRGVRLEAIRIGGAWHTSMEAFQRFCEALTELKSPSSADAETDVEDASSRVEKAGRELRTEGW